MVMNQARSRAIDRLRFDQRKKRVNTYPHSLGPTTDVVDPQQACLFEEQSHLLRDALDVLTTAERTAIETAFFFELTYEQTATKLNQPLETSHRLRDSPHKSPGYAPAALHDSDGVAAPPRAGEPGVHGTRPRLLAELGTAP